MGNNLEFILRLVDQFTPIMKTAAGVSDTAAGKIVAGLDKIKASTASLGSSNFGTKLASELNAPIAKAQQLGNELDKVGRKSSMGFMKNLIGGYSAYTLGKSIVTASSDAEMSKMNYSTLLGSKDKGGAMFNSLKNFGNDTILKNQDVYNNANTLLAFGMAGDKILPTLKMLGDVSLGDSGKFNSLSLAFAQTQSAGRLMGQDLLQYAASGFNPLQELSKMTGVSLVDLRAKMEQGGISAEMVSIAFQHATAAGGLYHDALLNASGTVAGKWGKFMGDIQTRLMQIGDFLQPVTKGIIDFGSALAAGEPIALTVATVIGGLALAIWAGTSATSAWAVALRIWNTVAAANPIILVISLIAVLVIWIVDIIDKYRGWGKSAVALWEITKSAFSLLGDAFKMLYENVVYYLDYAYLKMKDWGQTAIQFAENVGKALGQALTGHFSEAAATMTQTIKTTASAEISALEKQHAANQSAYLNHAIDNVRNIQDQWARVGIKAIPETSKAVDPLTANVASGAPGGKVDFKSLGDTGKQSADSINSGGQRSIVINIAKQIEKLEVHVMDAKEGANEIESMVREVMRRVVYGLNGVAAN